MNDSRHPRSPTSIAVGLILPLAILSASARPAQAETNFDAGDAQWKFLLGGGAINGPRYPGSRFDFTRGLPLVSISYGRYFLGAVPGGGRKRR